jgi:hypothetical protein
MKTALTWNPEKTTLCMVILLVLRAYHLDVYLECQKLGFYVRHEVSTVSMLRILDFRDVTLYSG